jgi:nucleotide-binding universal stress UspA family protein
MHTIVVGYDQTEAADRALERAATLAQAFGAKLVVTSVAPVLVGVGGGIDPADPPSAHEAHLRHAREFLAQTGLDADVVPALGDAAESIVEVAENAGADLIVVGAPEQSLLQRLLTGSVSGAVERKARCDVLIVH